MAGTSKKKKMSRKKKRRIMRKVIPVAVALVLIVIIAAFGLKSGVVDKLSYSYDSANLYEYFSLTSEDEVAVIMDNELADWHGLIKNGKYYIPENIVKEYFFDNYYYDKTDNTLLYTTASEVLISDESSGDFCILNDTLYMSVDYLQNYSGVKVYTYDNPNRMEIIYEATSAQVAQIKGETTLRVLGGVKSEVLRELHKGERVQVLSSMENWSELKTEDCFIGYAENKFLDDISTKEVSYEEKSGDPAIEHTLRNKKICMGWHQAMSADAAISTLESVMENAKSLNVISPTFFSIADNTGSINSIGSEAYVEKAHGMGLEVWGLVDNFSDDISSYEILSNSSTRHNLENNIMEAALSLSLDGINIDFEELTEETGEAFAQFIRELSIPCRQNGIVLSVDNYVPRNYTSYYNRRIQGVYADYVVIMGYDEHFAGSAESGSVASFDFVQNGIEKTIEEVNPNQIINGIPFYTRIWKEGTDAGSEAVSIGTAKEFVANHNIDLVWDDYTAQYYGEKQEGDTLYRVWMEDETSIKAKLDLMDSNNVAGAAFWKLGMDTADVWEPIGAYMSR